MYSASSEPGKLFNPRPLQNRVAEFWAILRFIQLHPWAPDSVHSVRPTVPVVPKISQAHYVCSKKGCQCTSIRYNFDPEGKCKKCGGPLSCQILPVISVSCWSLMQQHATTRTPKILSPFSLRDGGHAEVRCLCFQMHFLIFWSQWSPHSAQVSNPIKNFGFCGAGKIVGDPVHLGAWQWLILCTSAYLALGDGEAENASAGPWHRPIFAGVFQMCQALYRAHDGMMVHGFLTSPGILLRRTKVERAADVKSEADGNILRTNKLTSIMPSNGTWWALNFSERFSQSRFSLKNRLPSRDSRRFRCFFILSL